MIDLRSAVFGIFPRNTSVGICLICNHPATGHRYGQFVSINLSHSRICRPRAESARRRRLHESRGPATAVSCPFPSPIPHKPWKTIKVFLERLASGLSALVSALVLTLCCLVPFGRLTPSHIPTFRCHVSCFSRFSNTIRIL